MKNKYFNTIKTSLSGTMHSKPFIIMLKFIGLLILFWYLLCGMVLFVESGHMLVNTDALQNDETKVLILQEGEESYVSSDMSTFGDIGISEYATLDNDIITFSNGSEKDISEIEDYIKTVPGVSMWYVPDNHLAVPCTIGELVRECIPFYLVSLFIFVTTILYARSKKRVKETKLIGLSIASFVMALFDIFVSIIYSYCYYWYNSTLSNVLFYALIGSAVVRFLFILIYNLKGRE